ncbi:aspartic proteinase 36 isoform X2 [Elaeis guineensis]|uniref:Aspartic proteinase-like protein 2 isoform X2 n=1 Tax=Elaeis guineensis var. tenera TaxID=51953 RepID=A0A6I9RI60_ELAGV|nr:aspartic proteinase-like protein 2 isoform X2 [Elaeis guineensis]
MALPKPSLPPSLLLLLLLFAFFASTANGTGVFRVQQKLSGRKPGAMEDFKAHDSGRHERILSSLDFPIGGLGSINNIGLYYTQIGIGTPPKNYYVQVDTGSDLFWVNCFSCKGCPKKSNSGMKLTYYDPRGSKTGSLVPCGETFCSSVYRSTYASCSSNELCLYRVVYGDGSSSTGYFVTDYIQYDGVSGDHQTEPINASVTFGCGAQQSGDLGPSSETIDGILGFGQGNSSMISQLATSGKIRKIFAHCLDSADGSGIFAIGNVVQPKVNTTPLVPNQKHYNVNLTGIEVGGTFLELPTYLFDDGTDRGVIVDSGTTLAYLPDAVFKQLFNAMFKFHQDLTFYNNGVFICFSVDDEFPQVTFHFEKFLTLTVYPHEYLFPNKEDVWCVGWQNSGAQSRSGKDMFILGDLVLSNKLVVYDLENQVVGWVNHNCSSGIKIQDDETGEVYSVDAHHITSACTMNIARFTSLLLLIIMMCCLLY